MPRYVAFLRGINLGQKNKVAMPTLRSVFTSHGFSDVLTVLNTGNVVFTAEHTESGELASQITALMSDAFGLDVPVFVMTVEDLREVLDHAPAWWGSDDKEIYDTIIFVMPPTTPDDVFTHLGPLNEALEQAEVFGTVVFWSYQVKQYQKTNWWKRTATSAVADAITVRTANTIRKTLARG